MREPSLEPESSASANSAIPAFAPLTDDFVIITRFFRFVNNPEDKIFTVLRFFRSDLCI